MKAVDARRISVARYLESQGIKPMRIRNGGRDFWYSSPIRSGDKTPSFKVDAHKNLWFDHGLAQGGNVIDLVCELHTTNVAEALKLLEATGLGALPRCGTAAPHLFTASDQLQTSLQQNLAGEKEKSLQESGDTSAFKVLSVRDLQHPALLDYLARRGIELTIARHHLRQIHFSPRRGVSQYFALGFPCGEGYDARSALFRGFVGTGKTTSLIKGTGGNGLEGKTVAVFEGFMDYLSFLVHRRSAHLDEDALILHSVALKRRGAERLKAGNYDHIRLYLDHDAAGAAATNFLIAETGRDTCVDASGLYAGYNDLNEWLVSRQKNEDG